MAIEFSYIGGENEINFFYLSICRYLYGCMFEFTPYMTEYNPNEMGEASLYDANVQSMNQIYVISDMLNINSMIFGFLDNPTS